MTPVAATPAEDSPSCCEDMDGGGDDVNAEEDAPIVAIVVRGTWVERQSFASDNTRFASLLKRKLRFA